MSFITVTLRLLQGFTLSFQIFFITLLCAFPLGLLIAFCSMSKFKILRTISKTYVWIIRSTPLMLQIMLVFYGPGLIWGLKAMGRIEAVLVAFAINYSAYFSEIYRGGIESIPKGQYEAGQVLGMTKSQVFLKVILLQVIKRIVPPMGNEIITLAKDTSLARVIAVKELIMVSQEYIATYALIWPMFYSMVFYLAFCGILTLLLGYAERKLSYFQV